MHGNEVRLDTDNPNIKLVIIAKDNNFAFIRETTSTTGEVSGPGTGETTEEITVVRKYLSSISEL